jgi:hypothetical protein
VSNPFKSPKAPEAPPAPNPADIIREQENANRYNRVGPGGSRTWTTGPDGRSTLTDTLTPDDQALRDANNKLNLGVTGLAQGRVDWQNQNNAGGDLFFDELQKGVGDQDFNWLFGSGGQAGGYGGGGGGGGGGAAAYGGFNDKDLPELYKELDTSGLAELDQDTSAASQRARDAMFKRTSMLMEPERAQQQDGLRQKLANQGLVVGSDAWNDEFNRLDQAQNLSRERSALDADIAGGQEAQRLFQQALATRQQGIGERLSNIDVRSKSRGQLFGEQAQKAQLSESAAARAQAASSAAGSNAVAMRGQDIQARLAAAGLDLQRRGQLMGARDQQFNELATLIGSARGGERGTGFAEPGQIDVNGAYGLQNQANMNNYNNAVGVWNQNTQRRSNNINGALNFGAAMFSDRRVKENIKRVGKTDGGLPVYTYNYKGSPLAQMGVMAQEVEKVKPSAVTEVGGVKAVYYDQVE